MPRPLPKQEAGAQDPAREQGVCLAFTRPMNPFTLWTEFAFKLWGFGKPPAPTEISEKQVAVAVIPTSDARDHPKPKRAKAKVRTQRRAKRARR